MPILLDGPNINVNYSTSNFNIQCVKSELYIPDTNVNTSNILNVPIAMAPETQSLTSEPVNTNIIYEDFNNEELRTFTHSGGTENQTSYNIKIEEDVVCDILLVGGGGGGGKDRAGGGGSGALILSIGNILSGTYTIRVGNRGLGATSDINGANGFDSEIVNSAGTTIFRAKGGGGGQSLNDLSGIAPDGGSGGGRVSQFTGLGGNAVSTNIVNGITTGPAVTTTYGVYGKDGGRNITGWIGTNLNAMDGAGGGGIGEGGSDSGSLVPVDSQFVANNPGKGGDGLYFATINGVVYNFKDYFNVNGVQDGATGNFFICGGGGGGGDNSGALGKGGGGAGGTQNVVGVSATGIGSGGGGGGAGNANGGNGFAGIVIIKFRKIVNTEEIRTYLHSGGAENQTSYNITIGQNTICDILIVGGGGAGGGRQGGGGGAGGIMCLTNQKLLPGTHTIKVGKGGGIAGDFTAINGIDSEFGNNIAYGGSGGAGYSIAEPDFNFTTNRFASGGGAMGWNNNSAFEGWIMSNERINQPSVVVNGGAAYKGGRGWQDYSGDLNLSFQTALLGGGGGGAGGVGQDAIQNPNNTLYTGKAGDGGVGLYYGNLFGTNVGQDGWFGGGGGGAGVSTSSDIIGNGGKGGGGNGNSGGTGVSGINGTGGGGGAGGFPNQLGGIGGSGIVIVRLRTIVCKEEIRTFTHSGGSENQSIYNFTIEKNALCDILVVGGGGGGGSRHAGGGGAGAVIYSTNITLTAGTYTIGVGKGGTGKVGGAQLTTTGQGNKGEDSLISFNSTNIYLAKGGGAGNHASSTGNSNKDGGSGGGGGWDPGFAVSTNIPSGIYGNSGGINAGDGGPEVYAGGGGGGAGSTGNNATIVSGIGRSGNGGNGIQISITGTNVYYGGGGGGGTYTDANNIAGTGGLGGGGAGSKGAAAAISGTAGTGGGGGGGGFSSTTNGSGGDGGSGIVIIRIKSFVNNSELNAAMPDVNAETYKNLNFAYNENAYINYLTGMDNWVKIKHKPATKTNAYSGNTFNSTSISGTFTIGNPNDNNNEWAVEFNEPNVKFYLFVLHVSQNNSNYKDLWMVFEASEMKRASNFTTNYNYQSAYIHAYKTTMRPNGFAAKNSTNYNGPEFDQFIYNRSSTLGDLPDPNISMRYINIDGTWHSSTSVSLYADQTTHGYTFLPVTGGVYVKYDNDIPATIPYNLLTFNYRTDESPYSWQEALNEALAIKRRLPTINELKLYMTNYPTLFSQWNGTDYWTPVINPLYTNSKDWVQIGSNVNHVRGKSHAQETGGYPSWGDSSTADYSKIYFDVIDTNTPKLLTFSYRTDESPYSWQEAYSEARLNGRRLPTIVELRDYMTNYPNVFTQWNTLDIWSPVVNMSVANSKDWVQIGSNATHVRGKSHVDSVGGYPGWGDSTTSDYAKIYFEVEEKILNTNSLSFQAGSQVEINGEKLLILDNENIIRLTANSASLIKNVNGNIANGNIIYNSTNKNYISMRYSMTRQNNKYAIERMYPPPLARNFTSETTIVTGQSYGNGTYVVTGSSIYHTGLLQIIPVDYTHPFNCFNESNAIGGHWGITNYDTSYNYVPTNKIIESFDDGSYYGEWLKIKLPIALKLTKYSIKQRTGYSSNSPGKFRIYGSNNDIDWVLLIDRTSTNITYTNGLYTELTFNIFSEYAFFVLVVGSTLNSQTLNFDEWYLYGDEITNIIEPVVTPGITSVERMYPPLRDFTAATRTITGQSYGNGTYIVSSSSEYDSVNQSKFNIFNGTNQGWTQQSYTYGGTPAGTYTGSFSLSGYSGEWVKVQLPVPINLTRYIIEANDIGGISRVPAVYKIFGSNDNINWVELVNKSNPLIVANYVSNKYEEKVSTSNYYRYFALVVNKNMGLDIWLSIGEWYIYGKESYDIKTFVHSGGSENQTSHSITFEQNVLCDILIVGGGGGGGYFGGGGGAGGILFATNITITSGTYTIKVGKGGTGVSTASQNGTNGIDSSITINTIEYIAKGGGGGGTRDYNWRGINGNNGASGGGGSGTNDASFPGLGGASNKNNYPNFQSFGNSGGKGRPNIDGVNPIFSSGGGGGAGSNGGDYSNSTGGGNGGSGLNFGSIFGTSVGHNGWFGGGGGGNTYQNAGNPGYGNGGNGLSGGGGSGGYDGTTDISAINGLPHTGGGGGGGKWDGAGSKGGDGGSGIVIIRIKSNVGAAATIGNPVSQELLTFNYVPRYPVVDKSLLLHYKFDELGNGEGYLDSSGNGYNLTAKYGNIPIFSRLNYVLGRAAFENGSNGSTLVIPNEVGSQLRAINVATGISLSFWFNLSITNKNTDWADILCFMVGTDANKRGIIIGQEPSNSILTSSTDPTTWISSSNRLFVGMQDGTTNPYGYVGKGKLDREWHHFVWTITTAGVWAIYIDNVLQTYENVNQSTSGIIPNYSYTTNEFFGGSQTGQNNGYIDDFRIYKGVLTTAEISTLYNVNSPEYPKIPSDNYNLKAWYKFDDEGNNEGYLDSNPSITKHNLIIPSGSVPNFSSIQKIFGKSAYEGGIEARIQFPTSLTNQLYTINNTNGITFSLWYNMSTSTGSWANLFEFSETATDTNNTRRFGIGRNALENQIVLVIKDYIARPADYYYLGYVGTGTVNNAWHHIVWSISSTGVWTCYVDNINQNINVTGKIPNITNYNFSYILGSIQPTQTVSYIDDFRIYDKVLSETEVSILYHVPSVNNINTYTINFPVDTIANINDNTNYIFKGRYDIVLSSLYSQIIPKENQRLGIITKFPTSTMQIKYNIYNPISNSLLEPFVNNDNFYNSYVYENYTYTGTLNTTKYYKTFAENTICDILVVGGGGSGGSAGGSGGGGAVVEFLNVNIPAGDYVINVGRGGQNGSFGPNSYTPGSNGNTSSFIGNNIDIKAAGGGGGTSYMSNNATSPPSVTYINPLTNVTQTSQGGGGGSGGNGQMAVAYTMNLALSGRGGGNPYSGQSSTAGAGGGAAPASLGGNGGDSYVTSSIGFLGNGGKGIISAITNMEYGGGAAGSRWDATANNTIYGYATGGGGTSVLNGVNRTFIPADNGRGGGGHAAGNGGSGTVILRYRQYNPNIGLNNQKNLNFNYIPDTIVYNFSPFNNLNDWITYATSIGATTSIEIYQNDDVWRDSEKLGFIRLPLTNYLYDTVTVTYKNSHTSGTVNLYINGVVKSSCAANETKTYTQKYIPGDILRIEEGFAELGANLIITLSNANIVNRYNINFPVNTVVDFNKENKSVILRGNYNIVNLPPILYFVNNTTNDTETHTYVFERDTICDILVVAGGGGGGYFGGGGGAGGILFATNITITSGTYTIKVGKGGAGVSTDSQNGTNGIDSSITINTIEYIAKGGGGGGTRQSGGTGYAGRNGNSGGSGGGGSHSNGTAYQGIGGISNKNTYSGWLSYGNNGGKGRPTTGGSAPDHASGGGGGASSIGGDFSNSTGGGNGGSGLNFGSIFGTSLGHNGWFGGGGGGNTYYNAGNPGYGNGGNGLLGGGGSGGYDGTTDISATNGLPHTGGGGGGGKWDGEGRVGGDGGSGIVIIKQITSSYIDTSSTTTQSDDVILYNKVFSNTNIDINYNTTIATSNIILEPSVMRSINSDNILTFTNNGLLNTETYQYTFSSDAVCDILIVGGGGGGGADGGGGGGGGQVLYYTNDNVSFKSGNSITLSQGTYNINVGKGGLKSISQLVNASNGEISSIIRNSDNTTILSAGGGGGGGTVRLSSTGNNAIGGGGGNGHGNTSGSSIGGTSSAGGGTGGDNSADYGGGGGGGVNITGTLKNGGNATSSITGRGGEGVNIDINSITYGVGGGGSGGTHTNGAIGTTSQGGGAGGNSSIPGSNGVAGTGGGGGGGGNFGSAIKAAGDGGSGIVIIRIRYYTNILTFTNNGLVNTETYMQVFDQDTLCDILIVAGGGGGGMNSGGGGGAGGLILLENIIVSGTYDIKVGRGGVGGTQITDNTLAENGQNSSFGTYIAIGGGAGVNSGGANGNPGGSGGGAGNALTGNRVGGAGTPGQGFKGGDGTIPGGGDRTGGGGGGAGGAGQTSVSTTQGGNGGIGRNMTLYFGATYGASGWFAGGGGGGGGQGTGGTGGTGGGGNGGVLNQEGVNGTGGGGGAANGNQSTHGKKGGSGIVIIRIKTTITAGVLDGITHKKISLNYIFNKTTYNEYLAQIYSGVGGWRIVRYLPSTSATWYPINDNLAGTTSVGTAYDYSNWWTIPFGTFDEMMFATFNMKYWLYVTRDQAIGTNYDGSARTIIKSSISNTSYTANWYNRTTALEDPWIGLRTHNTAPINNPEAGGDLILYGENSYASGHGSLPAIAKDGGVCVLVRDSATSTTNHPVQNYVINFPVKTMIDINNTGTFSLVEGRYDINIGTFTSSITPKDGQYLQKPNTFTYNIPEERMYPPVRNFTAASMLISGQYYGNGLYNVKYSTFRDTTEPFQVFNENNTTGGHWEEVAKYNTTTGIYTGPDSLGGYSGDWVTIQLPVAIRMTRYAIKQRPDVTIGSPRNFRIYGSNNGSIWVQLIDRVDITYTSLYYNETNILLNGYYSYYGLVVNATTGNRNLLNFDEWYIYGYEMPMSAIELRYQLLNPIKDTKGAQWTYNSLNTNVYHMGNVGIGTKTPEYSLHVDGPIYTSSTAYTSSTKTKWTTVSDRRIKENIVKASYEKCLDNVRNIELYRFNFNNNIVNTNDKNQLGFIAQEVQKVYPKAVETNKIVDKNGNIPDLLTLNMTQLDYTLYGAVKQLIKKVENIGKKLEEKNIITEDKGITNVSLETLDITDIKIEENKKIEFTELISQNITSDTSYTLDTSDTSNISIDAPKILAENINNISIDTSNISVDTSNISVDTSNISVDTSNISIDTSNISVDTSNISIDTSNISIDTSNISVDTSNISVDTSNISVDTSNISVDTSNISIDTSNISVDTSNISIDTSNISVDTSNISIDTSNISVDTSNIVVDTSNISIDT
jgi:hypothetical protein